MPQNTNPTSTNSSMSSSVRFDLDPHDTSKILVYTYRVGVKTSSEQELCKTLDNDPRLRCSKIPIARGKSRVQIHQEDLYPASCKERKEYVELPNAKNNLASIILPRLAYYGRLLVGRYKNLYIVSQESPNSSPESSQYGSKGNSRQHTFHDPHQPATAAGETEGS